MAQDVTLAAGSNAIDRGVRLANINDGFRGTAPDLGALEVGCACGLVGEGALRDERGVEAAERGLGFVEEGAMARKVVEVRARRGDRRGAARREVGPHRFELGGIAAYEMKPCAPRSEAPRHGLRDRGGRAENDDSLEPHRVTRRQKLDENAGSTCALNSSRFGNDARKVAGDMRASFAG